MSQEAKDTITSKLKQVLPEISEFLTKEEVISLVEEAYTPKGKTLKQWLIDSGMPAPVLAKAEYIRANCPELYLSLSAAMIANIFPYCYKDWDYWCKVNKGIIPEITVKEWIDTLSDEVRVKAKDNTAPIRLLKVEHSLEDALATAFVWADTKEGYIFWRNVAKGEIK